MGVAVVDHSKLPDNPFELDPRRGTIISAFGRKGSGKTVFNRRLWRSWPYDALAIDVNGDADPGEGVERLHHDQLAPRFPVRHGLEGREHRKLVYRADPGSATYEQDLDRAIGMTLYPSDNPTLVWIGEVGEVSKGRRTRGNMRRLTMQSRHYGPMCVLFDGPRPCDIEPLVYLQSDGIAEYELPRADDREKMAELMGFDNLAEHDEAWTDNRRANGEFSFLFFHAPSGIVLACPPVPYP